MHVAWNTWSGSTSDLNVSRDARTVQLALSIVLRCPPVMFEAIDGENGGSTLLERIYLSTSGNPILAKPSACSKPQALLADRWRLALARSSVSRRIHTP